MIKKLARLIWKKLNPAMRLRLTRTTQDKFTVSVAALVFNEKDEILLLNHVFRSDLSWGFPGGFINSGEQPEAAVRRELREEIGLEIKDIQLVRLRTMNRHIEILFRASPAGTARVQSIEIYELGWFKIDEMPEKMSHVQKQIVEKVLNSKDKILID